MKLAVSTQRVVASALPGGAAPGNDALGRAGR